MSAMFALAAKDAESSFVIFAYFPAISFWFLDGYFLHQERLFRKLYDHVRGLQESQIDFSMSTKRVSSQVESWLAVVWSRTLKFFHGTVVLTIIVVMFIIIVRTQ